MLLSKEAMVHIARGNRKYYVERGYNVNYGDYVYVKVEDLPLASRAIVEVQCDYCGEVYQEDFSHYNRNKDIINKDACHKCASKKQTELFQVKYGVSCPSQLESSKVKTKQTCEKKYGKGVTNGFQVEENKKKARETCLERYGVENIAQLPEAQQKREETMLKKYGVKNIFCSGPLRNDSYYGKNLPKRAKNQSVSCSKSQRYLGELYNAQINYFYHYYFLDLFFEKENIYCEYNGAGHALGVKLGTTTIDEFQKKEKQRYHVLKKKRLKLFRIINENKNNKDKLPDDNILLQIKNIAFNFLKASDNNFFINFDLDNFKIITPEKEIEWDYKEQFEEYKLYI